MKLSRMVSGYIVREMVAVLGDEQARKVLGVDAARFKFLHSARGCLSVDQLDRVSKQTGKAWERWVIDAGARGVKSGEGRAYVAKARQMWDKLLDGQNAVPAGKQTIVGNLRHVG